MTGVELPSAVVNTFTYNPDNLRVKKQDCDGSSNFLWDAQNVLLETNQAGATQALYTLEPVPYGNIVSQSRDNNSLYYHFDALGSTDRLTDSLQAPSTRYIFEAFGSALIRPSGIVNPFEFIGREGYYSDTAIGAYYLRARHYDPSLARFLSRDPIASASERHWYQYAHQKPLRAVDPSGQAVQLVVPGVLRCLGGIGGSLLSSWLREDEAWLAICKAAVSCVIGAIGSTLATGVPPAAGCINGAAGGLATTIGALLCSAILGCPADVNTFGCFLFTSIVTAALGCLLQFRINLEPASRAAINNAVATLVGRVVGTDLAMVCPFTARTGNSKCLGGNAGLPVVSCGAELSHSSWPDGEDVPSSGVCDRYVGKNAETG